VIGQVAHAFAPAARKKGLDLWFDIDPALPEFILGDQYRLGQIITNLVNNAVKFTAQGSVRISCRPARGRWRGASAHRHSRHRHRYRRGSIARHLLAFPSGR
jgi:signal transduction histidine kinase